MGNARSSLRNIKLEFRPSSPLLKVAVIVLIVFSMAAILSLFWVRTSIHNRTEEIRAEAAALEHENTVLTEKIGRLDSVESVREIAREELGLVDPNTVILNPNS